MTTPKTPRSLNLVPEILGWTGHDELQRSFGFFCTFSVIEGAGVGLAWYFTQVNLPHRFASNALMPVTLSVVLLRLVWSLYCFCGYRAMKGADINAAIHGMRRVQTSQGLSMFAGFWSATSVFLMAWHTIIALLIFEANNADGTAANGLGMMFFLFAVSHYLMCSKSAAMLGPVEAAAPDTRMEQLRDMYKNGRILLRKYGTASKENPDVSSLCCICLEDFGDHDEVAQLPCSHIFHPKCSHLWIRKHWSCPLRCDVLEQSFKPASSDVETSTTVVISSPNAATEVDVETGSDLRALGRASSTPPSDAATMSDDIEHGAGGFVLPGLSAAASTNHESSH